jgi:spore germination cell wall hydrolase CwlJ-like protein
MKQFIRRMLLLASLGLVLSIPITPFEELPLRQPKAIIQTEKDCLAQVIYFEAGNQPFEGKKAVAHVVLNRAKQTHLGICEVTHQIVGGQKQFPPVFMDIKVNQKQFKPCDFLADQILRYPDLYPDNTNEAIYFHEVSDTRFGFLTKTAEIGGHVFYR